MATLHTYTCPDCGYEITAPQGGVGFVSTGPVFYFRCDHCKEILALSLAALNEFKGECPDCHNPLQHNWNPEEGHCPKCGSKMVKDEETIIMAD